MAQEIEGMSGTFRDLVGKFNEEYRDRQYTDWLPEPGDYTVAVGRVKVGQFVNRRANRTEPWVRVPVTIMDGPHAGKEFPLGGSRGVFTPAGFGYLGAAASVVANGEPVMDFGTALEVLGANEGAILLVRVSEREVEGRKYTNVRVVQLVAGAAPTA